MNMSVRQYRPGFRIRYLRLPYCTGFASYQAGRIATDSLRNDDPKVGVTSSLSRQCVERKYRVYYQ